MNEIELDYTSNYNENTMSNLFRLDSKDWIKGLVVAVLVAIVGAVQQMLQGHGLDFALYDWAGIMDIALKAGAGYLMKNFLTDDTGKIVGAIG